MPIIVTATPAGPYQIDVTLDLGENMTSPIRLEISEDGTTWPTVLDMAAGTVLYHHAGLPAEATRHYRASFLVQTVDTASTSEVETATTDEVPAGLSYPLDDAIGVWRASAASPIPNEGTRTEGLVIGSPGPVFVPDAVDGGYLKYNYPSGSIPVATVPFPPACLNGDVTFAIRLKPTDQWTARHLLDIIDDPTGNALKHFYLTLGTNNTYLSRFWDVSANRSQIPAQGATARNGSVIDTVVVTWTSADKTNRLYLNGVLEASATTGYGRTSTTGSALLVPVPSGAPYYYKFAGKMFALASWNRALSAAEIAALQTNVDWNHKA